MSTPLVTSPRQNDLPTPSSAALAALGAGLLIASRPARQSPVRTLATVAGLALLGAAAQRPLARALKSAGMKRRSGVIRFSFVVDQPVGQVFAFCADFENFPKLISVVRSVRDNGDGHSRWCATTPSGGTVEWNAVTTKFVTNKVIGWRSAPGAAVQMTGLLRFIPEGDGTCVKVAIDYNVVSSGLADALAALARPRRARQIEREIREHFTRKA